MKRILLLITTLMSMINVNAQNDGIDIGAYAGYTTNGLVRGSYGEFRQRATTDYGAYIAFPLDETKKVFLEYIYMDTQLEAKEYTYPGSDDVTNASVQYYQIGGENYVNTGSAVVFPYGALSLGATYFGPTGESETGDIDFNSSWAFSMTLGGGVKLQLSEKIGVKLKARLLVPMQFSGVGLTFGTGGAGAGVYTRAMLQADFTGGVFLTL